MSFYKVVSAIMMSLSIIILVTTVSAFTAMTSTTRRQTFGATTLCWAPVQSSSSSSSSSSTTTTLLLSSSLLPVDVSDRYFQLEELEDQEACTTELFLNPDRTVTVGETNGPVFVSATGTWEQKLGGGGSTDGSSSFIMVLKRTYKAGKEKTAPTSMGEFQFEVERTFLGELTRVGDSIAVTGTMHHFDDIFGDSEVGFFNLIDTTEERTSSP